MPRKAISKPPVRSAKANRKVAPPKPGPGRPRKPRAPRDDRQADLAAAVEIAEAERDAAAAAYANDTTVAAEVRLLRAEVGTATAWGALCRAQGIHTHALKYGDLEAKLAARIAALRELLAVDLLAALAERAEREDALG